MSSACAQNTVNTTEIDIITVNSSVHMYLAMLNIITTKHEMFIEYAGYL